MIEKQERDTAPGKCNRCGACCKEGGAALHSEDLDLLRFGKIPLEHLITVRKGELNIVPAAGGAGNRAEIAGEEFIKLGGRAGSWCCRYYLEKEKMGGCGIYTFRPLACRTLQCWDTSGIERLIGKNLLHRKDILAALPHSPHPLLTAVEQHEKEFPCDCVGELYNASLSSIPLASAQRRELERLLQRDLDFRKGIAQEYNLSVGGELFFFGRPLFQVIAPLVAKSSPIFSLRPH